MKQVIVIRKDLNMRKGKMCAQAAHASLSAYKRATSEVIKKWEALGQTKVCVSVDSEQELLDIYNKAAYAGMPCALIRDEGRTEFKGVPTLTCLAIGPYDDTEIDKITGHLKLL